MSDFRTLSDSVLASPQLSLADIEAAKEAGVSRIVNNRPEGESADQVPGPEIEAAARAAGMDYVAIPVGHGGLSAPQIEAMQAALDGAEGKVLAYCRSGTRSTFLWALAQARSGEDPAALAEAAGRAGYDLAPLMPTLAMLSGRPG